MHIASALRGFPDHRPGQGIRYPLHSIILLVLTGFLCGRDSLAGVARFSETLTRPQLKRLGIRRGRAPCHSTLCVAFHGIDADRLASLFGGMVLLKNKGKEPVHLSIDGKTLCGSRKGEGQAVHILHAFAAELGGLVGQVSVPDGTNEVGAMLNILDRLELKQSIITADAMFCQKTIVEKITEKGGDYMIVVKDNQETLHRRMEAAFESEMINQAYGGKNTRKRHARVS